MLLLPTEDLENGCLTALVGQIFSEMILGNGIGGKASEPWLLWEVITKVADVVQGHISKAEAEGDGANDSAEPAQGKMDGHEQAGLLCSARKWFWLVLQYALMALTALRFFITMLTTSSSLPSRRKMDKVSLARRSIDEHRRPASPAMSSRSTTEVSPYKQPIISMKIWTCISRLLDLDMRMPWLSATFSLLQWGALCGPWKVGDTDGMIDKYVTLSFHLSVAAMSGAHQGLLISHRMCFQSLDLRRASHGGERPSGLAVVQAGRPAACLLLLLSPRWHGWLCGAQWRCTPRDGSQGLPLLKDSTSHNPGGNGRSQAI